MNIQITDRGRKSPVEIKFSSVATRSEIIELALVVERFLEEAREIRAAVTKLNGSSPIPIRADSYLDDVIHGGLDLLSNIEGLPDAIRERYEGDR
jgi:hypothetical protein